MHKSLRRKRNHPKINKEDRQFFKGEKEKMTGTLSDRGKPVRTATTTENFPRTN